MGTYQISLSSRSLSQYDKDYMTLQYDYVKLDVSGGGYIQNSDASDYLKFTINYKCYDLQKEEIYSGTKEKQTDISSPINISSGGTIYIGDTDWHGYDNRAGDPIPIYLWMPPETASITADVTVKYYPGNNRDGSPLAGTSYTDDSFSWWRNGYSIYYNKNTTDNVDDMPSQDIKLEDKDYYISNDIPTREGYTFIGWCTDAIPIDENGKWHWIYHPSSIKGKKDWDYTAVNEDKTFYAIWLPNIASTIFKNFIKDPKKKEKQDIWFSKVFEHNITFNNIGYNNNNLPNFPEALNDQKVGTCGGWIDVESYQIYSNDNIIKIPNCEIIYHDVAEGPGSYELKKHIYTFRPIWTTLENPKTKVIKYINNQYTIAVIFEMTAKIFIDDINNIQYAKNVIGDIYCEQLDKNSKQFISKQIYSPKDYYFNPYGINYVSFIFEKNKITEQDLVNLLFTTYYQINAYSTKKLNFSINLLDIIQTINIKVPDTTTCLKIPKTEKSTITKIHIKC